MTDVMIDVGAQARAAQLKAARESTAAEFKLDLADSRVQRYALLKVNHDDLTARYLADGSDLGLVERIGKLHRAMEEISESVPLAPQTIKVEFIKGEDATPDGSGVCGCEYCRHCKWKPPSPRDYLSQCPLCGWTEGCDTYRLKPPKHQFHHDEQPDDTLSAPTPHTQSRAPKAISGPAKGNVNDKPDKPDPHASTAHLADKMLRREPGSDGDWKNHIGVGGDPRTISGESHPYVGRNGHQLPGADGGLCWFGTAK